MNEGEKNTCTYERYAFPLYSNDGASIPSWHRFQSSISTYNANGCNEIDEIQPPS